MCQALCTLVDCDTVCSCDGVSTRRSSTGASSASSEFSEEYVYQRINREQQNQINEEQHRTRTMQRRAEIPSLHNRPEDKIEAHRIRKKTKSSRTLRDVFRVLLLELDIDIDSSHGRYRKRSIDRRPALNTIVHPPFEVIPESDNECANTAPELSLSPPIPAWPKRKSSIIRDLSIFGGSHSPRERSAPIDEQLVRGKHRRSSSRLLDLTLFKKVQSVDEIHNNCEPRNAEGSNLVRGIYRRSSTRLLDLTLFKKVQSVDEIYNNFEPRNTMVRQSSSNLTKQFSSVRNMFTKNAVFDEGAPLPEPMRNNILLATMEKRQSNNIAIKKFDADDY